MTDWTKEYLVLCVRKHGVKLAMQSLEYSIRGNNRASSPEDMREMYAALDEVREELNNVNTQMVNMRKELTGAKHGLV